jgi:hypothetical protein
MLMAILEERSLTMAKRSNQLKIVLIIFFVLVVLQLVFIYADSCYLRLALISRIADAQEREQLTLKEIILNREKYKTLLKERFNVTDYTP